MSPLPLTRLIFRNGKIINIETIRKLCSLCFKRPVLNTENYRITVTGPPKSNLPKFPAVLSFGATVCKTVRPMLSDRCPVCPVLSGCDVRALWPNGWTDQDETWHAGRPRRWPHCVRWGPSSPSPKGAQPPNFRPISVAAKWLHGSRFILLYKSMVRPHLEYANSVWCPFINHGHNIFIL